MNNGVIRNSKILKLISTVLALALVLTVLTGCGPAATTTGTSSQMQASSAAPPVAASFPVTLTDHLGRTVEIQSKPQRIVSGYYIATSLLIALGLEDQIVGLEAKADKRPIYALSAPRLMTLPNVGTAKDFNLEGALALKPDLVILPIRLKDAIQTLAGMGIATIGINPESQVELDQVIRLVGQATGTMNRAAALLAKSRSLADKAIAFGKDEPKQRIYLSGNSTFLSTAGSNMYQSSLIKSVGGANVAEAIEDTTWAGVSYEQLLQWQPDLIIIVPEAVYSVSDVLNDSALSGLKAVRDKKVYQMPKQFEAWDSPVPSGVLGQLYIASVLYPQKYSAADFATDLEAFYKEFYDFEANVVG